MRLIARTRNLAPSGNVIVCPDTAANNILVINDFLQFPNVVTPNGDGINDRFVIQNLVDGLGYPINSLDIYNQWGVRVYHRENIASDDEFWDPADVPDGTYFYRFSARGYNGNIEHNGSIEVIH
jgi:gliding motility-associated-like protein